MRILHSSDWHLGLSHGSTSMEPDQRRFLDWLLDHMAKAAIDVLIVAGDIFDQYQPPAEAQALLYRFLARVRAAGVAQVILVGGNHDSGARLNAPAPLLADLNITVIGALPADDRSACVVPLRGRSGAVEAVALAVPYVHEHLLGVRTTEGEPIEVRDRFLAAFQALYGRLIDEAQARFPSLPIVATGHLTLAGSRRADYPREIHQVGTIDALPEGLVDPRIQYLALGHIHRSFPLAEGRAWYSGSPLPCAVNEHPSTRQVLEVTLDPNPAGRAAVRPIKVPAARAFLSLEGDAPALLRQIRGLTWTEPLPPLLFLRVILDPGTTDLAQRLHEALAAHPPERRPAIADWQAVIGEEAPTVGAPPLPPSLRDMAPIDVFAALCEARKTPLTDALRLAFGELDAPDEADWSRHLDALRQSLP